MLFGWCHRQTEWESNMPDDHTPCPKQSTCDTCLMTPVQGGHQQWRSMLPAASTNITRLLNSIL